MAHIFEGEVVLEIRRGDEVVERLPTTARPGMRWSPWSATRRLPTGDYTVAAFTEDARGVRRDLDTKDFTVE